MGDHEQEPAYCRKSLGLLSYAGQNKGPGESSLTSGERELLQLKAFEATFAEKSLICVVPRLEMPLDREGPVKARGTFGKEVYIRARLDCCRELYFPDQGTCQRKGVLICEESRFWVKEKDISISPEIDTENRSPGKGPRTFFNQTVQEGKGPGSAGNLGSS